MKTNKTLDSCYADFSSFNMNPKLDQNKESNVLNVVSFAPFLMWNNHDNNYFQNVGKINNMAINENNIYETPKSCNNDDNYVDLMKEAFFSLENMDIIQNRIIISVYLKSDKTLRVNKIKNETLLQVMNSIWTNFCRFLPYDLKEQIDELDNRVVEYIVPLLLKESQFYFNYLRDSDRTNLPQLDRPIMINKDRKQQLPSFYK
jgi:hypothetical protein